MIRPLKRNWNRKFWSQQNCEYEYELFPVWREFQCAHFVWVTFLMEIENVAFRLWKNSAIFLSFPREQQFTEFPANPLKCNKLFCSIWITFPIVQLILRMISFKSQWRQKQDPPIKTHQQNKKKLHNISFNFSSNFPKKKCNVIKSSFFNYFYSINAISVLFSPYQCLIFYKILLKLHYRNSE
jgi:hypothetical protein